MHLEKNTIFDEHPEADRGGHEANGEEEEEAVHPDCIGQRWTDAWFI